MKRFSVKASRANSKRRVVAADEDESLENMDFEGDIDSVDDGFQDTLDDVADAVEDIQDTVDEDKEDEVSIEIENNIDDHYIAECEKCHGIFISATVESDQDVQKVTGECPLCGEESDQYLKWVVKKVNHSVADPTEQSGMMPAAPQV